MTNLMPQQMAAEVIRDRTNPRTPMLAPTHARTARALHRLASRLDRHS